MKYQLKKEVKREATTVTRDDFLSIFLEGMSDAKERLRKARRSRARRKKKKRGPLVDCYNHWWTITDAEVSKFKSGIGFDDTFGMAPLQQKGAAKSIRGLRSIGGGGRQWTVFKDGKLFAILKTNKAECFVERC